ncbi:hypothetical protein [Desulfogranum marinum]|uniref:hypothetical protein n=1 Tax=Desulfogranum marinum TaxID=453220 RepID=UPI001965A582|nr:hypothetical protein [Desulfogranum marinum]MBM9515207.1 hypothetical protein [Desulfogranum marinum]
MKKIALAIVILFVASSCLAADYTIRENNSFGQPNRWKSGTVIEDNGDGSYTARQEIMPGTGRGNPFTKGEVITPNEDGSWKVQEEIMPGSGRANTWDSGYTIERDDY